jgi:hypothetical protein
MVYIPIYGKAVQMEPILLRLPEQVMLLLIRRVCLHRISGIGER